MHWFIWFLIILYAANIGVAIARLDGYNPKPTSPWIGLVVGALILAGIIIYLA